MLNKEKNKIIIKIINLLKDYYPFKNKEEFEFFKRKFEKFFFSFNESEFIATKKAVAAMRHSHFRLDGYPWILYKPNKYDIKLIEGRFILFYNDKIIGEVLNIDGQSPKVLLKEKNSLITSSTDHYLANQALKFLLVDKIKKPVKLKIKNKKGIKSIELKRSILSNNFNQEKNIEFIKKDKIGYLKIRFWNFDKDFKTEINKLIRIINKETNHLIIDLRGNQGGDSRACDFLAGHFFNKKVLFGYSKRRISQNNFKLKKYYYSLNPIRPYIPIPIIILTDVECFSSTELFIAGMKDNKRAILIGEKTGGGTGNPKKFNLKIGEKKYNLYIPTWIYHRKNKKLIEGRGIEPDIPVISGLQDFKNKTDKVLRKAMNL